jgi:hypothetical protein
VLDRGLVIHAEASAALLQAPERLGALMGVAGRAEKAVTRAKR